jgi:hypothetical protein
MDSRFTVRRARTPDGPSAAFMRCPSPPDGPAVSQFSQAKLLDTTVGFILPTISSLSDLLLPPER